MDKDKMFWNILKLEEVGSTNDYARDLVSKGAKEGTVVAAEKQLQGKGRRGRIWDSPKGNLYASIVLKFDCEPTVMGQLSFVASLSLMQVLNKKSGKQTFFCKWPNDVITKDCKKISGILIETTGIEKKDFVILGMGVNTKYYPEDIVSNMPASSLLENGVNVTAEELLNLFLDEFEKNLIIWKQNGFKPIRDEWLGNAYGLGKEIEIRLPKNTFKGVFKDLDNDGAIIFENQEGELKKINSGEVFFR